VLDAASLFCALVSPSFDGKTHPQSNEVAAYIVQSVLQDHVVEKVASPVDSERLEHARILSQERGQIRMFASVCLKNTHRKEQVNPRLLQGKRQHRQSVHLGP
jgi:hypothetical protein